MPLLTVIILSIGLALGGLVTLFIAIRKRQDNALEQQPVFWLGLGLIGAGVIGYLSLATGRHNPYLIWSSAVALLLTAISFFLRRGRVQQFPAVFWLGLGTLTINGIFWLSSLAISNAAIPILWVASIVTFGALFLLQRASRSYVFNIFLLYIVIMAMFSAMVETKTIRSDVQYLNEVLVPQYNQSMRDIQQKQTAYATARRQALDCREVINSEFPKGDDGTPYLDLADQDIARAQQSSTKVQSLTNGLPGSLGAFSIYSPTEETKLLQYQQTLSDARFHANTALELSRKVCTTSRDLASSWTLTILWIEQEGYWTSEESDSPSMQACYYGEQYTTNTAQYKVVNGQVIEDQPKVQETIVDDTIGFDQENVSWKVFLPDDYYRMVQDRWIPAMQNPNPTDNEIADYLCGTNGILGEGSTFVKAAGTNIVELEDQEDLYVGDTRYGSWCRQNPDGSVTLYEENAQLPPDAEWCWYQAQGRSTGYYYTRTYVNNHYVYYQGPRRCNYCTPQNSWSGGDIVPDSRLSRINSTEASIYRRPSDVGGGPGSGK